MSEESEHKQLEGRVNAEYVLERVRWEIEHEISELWKIPFKPLREIEGKRLGHKLDDTKKALVWAKEQV